MIGWVCLGIIAGSAITAVALTTWCHIPGAQILRHRARKAHKRPIEVKTPPSAPLQDPQLLDPPTAAPLRPVDGLPIRYRPVRRLDGVRPRCER